jgi:hypothetical protein
MWTELELLDMDLRFCQAMRRAHPKLGEPQATGDGSVGVTSESVEWKRIRAIAKAKPQM